MEVNSFKNANGLLEIFDDQLRMLYNRLVNSLNEEILCYRQSVVAVLNDSSRIVTSHLQTSHDSDEKYSHSDAENSFGEGLEQSEMTLEECVYEEIKAKKALKDRDIANLLLKIMMHSNKILMNCIQYSFSESFV